MVQMLSLNTVMNVNHADATELHAPHEIPFPIPFQFQWLRGGQIPVPHIAVQWHIYTILLQMHIMCQSSIANYNILKNTSDILWNSDNR